MSNSHTLIATTAVSLVAALATMVPEGARNMAWSSAGSMATTACKMLHLSDEPPPPPEDIDVLEDLTSGPHPVPDVLDMVLRRAASRPGSVVRLWLQGNDVGSTTMVGPPIESVASHKRGVRALKAHEDQFVASARQLLLNSLQALPRQPPKRSPIAESLAKISLIPSEHARRHIIVLSDGRECSPRFGDFECKALPGVERFLKELHAARVLLPGTLARCEVTVAFMTMGPVEGRDCPVSIERETRIRELWKAALTAAGATRVSFSLGPPEIENESSTSSSGKEA